MLALSSRAVDRSSQCARFLCSVHEGARNVATTNAYLVSRRQRKKVEMLFAQLKRILRMDRLRLRGPNGARDEFLLAATAQNVRLDAGTLEDAQLQPVNSGIRVLPRPGKAKKVNFPLVLTGEIDGTVYLIENGASCCIGNAQIELLDAAGEVIGSTQSASDGFYVLSRVRAGQYSVRISPVQIEELELPADGAVRVVMPREPDFVSVIDLHLTR